MKKQNSLFVITRSTDGANGANLKTNRNLHSDTSPKENANNAAVMIC